MNFTFSKLSGFATAVVWTLGWLRIAILTEQYLVANPGAGSAASATIALLGVASGCWGLIRFFPRYPQPNINKPSPPEPWHRRVTGWGATIVWCGAGAIWNLGIYSVLVRSAINGQTLNFFILIPFEIVGFFLLLLLFVGVGFVLDFIFGLDKEIPPKFP